MEKNIYMAGIGADGDDANQYNHSVPMMDD